MAENVLEKIIKKKSEKIANLKKTISRFRASVMPKM